MKEHLFARLDAAVDRVWEAVREAEEAGMQMDRVRQDLEMVPYLKESLSRAPEGMQERMVARLAARWEEFAEKVRQDALYRRQEMEKRRAAEERALQKVLQKWPELAGFSVARFEWETPFGGEGYVAGVVFHTPWGDDLRAWREGKEYEWVLQHRDGVYWEEVKDLDAVLVQKAIDLARRWQVEEVKRKAEEARRHAEKEARRRAEEAHQEREAQRKRWTQATAREWLQRAANAAWEANQVEQALEAIAYALVGLLAAFVEEDEFVAPFVPVRAELEEDGQAHAVVQ